MEDIRARYATMAVANVRKQLALAEIVKAEKIEADDASVEARFEELATQFGMKVEDVKARIDVEDIKSEVETLKAFEVVKNSAKVTEKTVTREELEAILNPEAAAATEEKPKKKTTAKKTTAKKAEAEGEEKAEKPATKRTCKPKAEKAEGEEAPKKTTRKTTKKADAE